MPKFRKKPVEINAIRWTGDNIDAVMGFMHPQQPIHPNDLSHMRFTNADDLVGIETLEGVMFASKGDWIIRGVQGEFYPCKPDIFAATYEPVATGHVEVHVQPDPPHVADAIRDIRRHGGPPNYRR
ncbi:hypothetical protein ACFYWS_39430 [Streptomyces sp. NPDC002795]|uniref:hypothetical protein n=1 Tax=Streptomyces sp. NPDC002795 TaxID=3364665 RepID=UPI0036B511B4